MILASPYDPPDQPPPLAGDRAAPARRLGSARPPAGARRPLVYAAAGQPRHRRAQHPAAAEDPALPPDEAAGAVRPPGLRPRGGRGGGRAGPRAGGAARGAGPAGGALRPRDRPRLQRLLLLPDRLLALQAGGPAPLPRAARLLGRGGARRRHPGLDAGLPDEPPQQHGLRPGGLSGRGPHRPLLRRGRVGADLAAPDPDPLDRGLLRAAELGRSALPPGAGALHPHADRRRRPAGRLSRGAPLTACPGAAAPAGLAGLPGAPF